MNWVHNVATEAVKLKVEKFGPVHGEKVHNIEKMFAASLKGMSAIKFSKKSLLQWPCGPYFYNKTKATIQIKFQPNSIILSAGKFGKNLTSVVLLVQIGNKQICIFSKKFQ